MRWSTAIQTATTAAVMGWGSMASGQSAIVPSDRSGNPGDGQLSSVLNRNTAPRAYQWVIADQQLFQIPDGAVIWGMGLRLSTAAGPQPDFPDADVRFSNYRIFIGRSLRVPGEVSTVFANNMDPTDTREVRSGPLVIPAGAFRGGGDVGTANSFGQVIRFDRPYVFFGGPLAILVRHSGHDGNTSPFLDSMTTASEGYGTQFEAVRANSEGAGSGFQSSFTIVELEYARPEDRPAGLTKLFVPGSAALRWGDASTGRVAPGSPVTLMSLISPDEFGRVSVGSRIVEVGYRAARGAPAWPSTDLGTTLYQLKMGPALRTPAEMSEEVAENARIDALVTAIDTPLSVAAGALEAAAPEAVPNSPTWNLRLDRGVDVGSGPLAMLLSTMSWDNQPQVDAVFADPSFGVRVASKAFDGLSQAPLTPLPAPFPVTRFGIEAGGIVPRSLAEQFGDQAVSLEPFSPVQRVLQMVIAEAELSHIPLGSTIDGLEFRPATSFLGSVDDMVYEQYTVRIGRAAREPGDMSTTFAQNESADVVSARTGSLLVPAGGLPRGGISPLVFGGRMTLDRKYVYRGGPLVIRLTHRGGGDDSELPLDALSVNAPEYGVAVEALAGQNAAAQVGVRVPSPIVRLSYTPSATLPADAGHREGSWGINLTAQPGGLTYQWAMSSTELGGVPVGAILTGISFRTTTRVATWPTADDIMARFDLSVGRLATQIDAMSSDFNANIGSDGVVVREGELRIPARSVVGGSQAPNEFSWVLEFARPYQYRGGPLVFTLRTTADSTFHSFDAWSAADPGFGTSMRALFAVGVNATTATAPTTDVLVSRVYFTPGELVCRADFDGDGFLDLFDFDAFVGCFENGACPPDTTADYDGDGFIDLFDYDLFVADFEQGC